MQVRRTVVAILAALAVLMPAKAANRPIAIEAQGVIFTGGEVRGDHVSGQMQTFYELPAGTTTARRRRRRTL